nr:putative ribonuclease H-like domain-containing protein [Tanacetum cinerariifolium]
MWLFKHKFHAGGTLGRYKAQLVANGSSQQLEVDFDETFSPVVKPATIHTVLSLVVSRQWLIYQLDVKNAFLNGDLSETVYMHQPPSFVDSRYPNHGSQVAYLLIYVDDIILTASSPVLFQQIVDTLHKEFDMTDLRALNYFLGISVVRHPTGLLLSQKKYAIQLLERAHMANCNPSRTPVDTDSKLGPDGVHVQDPTLYRSLAGGFRHPGACLHLYASATTSLVGYTDVDWAGCPFTRESTFGYCVFLGDNLLSLSAKRQHTISRSSAEAKYRGVANVVTEIAWIRNLLRDNLLSWSAKRQHTISRSSAEAKYRGVANVVTEIAWIRNLLRELHSPLLTATLVYCDNVRAVYMSANPVQHQRTKHIEIDIHFVRDMVKAGHVRVLHVPSRFQYADIFTKGLSSALFEDFRSSLSIRPPPA